MQQKAINLRPRDFKLMVTGICTRLIVTFILSVSKETRMEKLIETPDLGEEGSLMLLVGTHTTQELCRCHGACFEEPGQPAHTLYSLNVLKTVYCHSFHEFELFFPLVRSH